MTHPPLRPNRSHPRVTTPNTWRSLKAELRQKRLYNWVKTSAKLQGTYIVPGTGFICVRGLLIYPPSHFLACGMLGLCGMALYPTKKGPFLDMDLLPDGFLDTFSLPYLEEEMGYSPRKIRVHQRIVRVRDFVLQNFNIPWSGKPTRMGEKDFNLCVERGLLAPLSPNS